MRLLGQLKCKTEDSKIQCQSIQEIELMEILLNKIIILRKEIGI